MFTLELKRTTSYTLEEPDWNIALELGDITDFNQSMYMASIFPLLPENGHISEYGDLVLITSRLSQMDSNLRMNIVSQIKL